MNEPHGNGTTVEDAPSVQYTTDQLLAEVATLGGSDLHITAGVAPALRINGHLRRLDTDELTPKDTEALIYRILTTQQQKRLETDLQVDLSYAVPGVGRFRANVYYQRNSLGAAFRLIPTELKPLEQLGMPESLHVLTAKPRGLVLVTGPTGSGKSTTLASMIDEINRTRRDHIMTIEDPIEFLHSHKQCVVNQREIGADAIGFADALRGALRQDPDVILVGEMRDLETIATALTAAETGHLVFATLHTQDAPSTIDRMIDVFPGAQQGQIRTQLAAVLQGVVTQTLLPTADGTRRVPAVEVLLPDDAVRNLIRQAKAEQIYSVMQTGTKKGMLTLEQSLAHLVNAGTVKPEIALARSSRPEQLQALFRIPGAAPGALRST
jgi:twitching motility protein PilT